MIRMPCINTAGLPPFCYAFQTPTQDYAWCVRDIGGAGPLLEALGDAYETPCEGTAFYALQSCMNHSCSPNAHAMKRDEQDVDGAAVILAKQAFKCGEEVFLSYIDESMDFAQRTELLLDYGITCQCPRCKPHRRQS